MPVLSTFNAKIHSEITKWAERLLNYNPDGSNAGGFIARAFFWDQVQAYAKKQSDAAWEQLEKEDLVRTSGLTEGAHTLCESKNFIVLGTMSKPYKKFREDILAEMLKKKYKVPLPASKELIEAAKVEDKGRLSLKIIER
ncbi:MAG TPA: hypothetical protein VIY48_13545 [Candidatus Paceibacterota bacterium]